MSTVATTIATSFPELFITLPGAKRLTYKHRNSTEQCFSDHVAILQAYQQWEQCNISAT